MVNEKKSFLIKEKEKIGGNFQPEKKKIIDEIEK
jgi:hypothetical protein